MLGGGKTSDIDIKGKRTVEGAIANKLPDPKDFYHHTENKMLIENRHAKDFPEHPAEALHAVKRPYDETN